MQEITEEYFKENLMEIFNKVFLEDKKYLIKVKDGDDLIVMSPRAYKALTEFKSSNPKP